MCHLMQSRAGYMKSLLEDDSDKFTATRICTLLTNVNVGKSHAQHTSNLTLVEMVIRNHEQFAARKCTGRKW